MKKIKELNFETENARFNLTVYERTGGKGFVGEYYGTSPKFAQVTRPGAPAPMMKEIGSGKLTHNSLEQLLAACRAEIEKIDGPIQRTIEQNE
jgi:hypothetical protein